jgi:protein-tyrosine-phosphatase
MASINNGGFFMRRAIRDRNVLFLDQDNASLSQMAEAVAKHLGPPKVRIFSAGVTPSSIPVPVRKVMQELGISMSAQNSKGVDQVPLNEIDLVVSFAGADEKCAALPAKAKVKKWALPSSSAKENNNFGAISTLRQERDEINKRVFALFMDYWRNLT